MHPGLERLLPYPFERLARLLADTPPPEGLTPIALSIGEPKHAAPRFVVNALIDTLGGLGTYPATAGLPAFRRSAAAWLDRRYALNGLVDPERMLLPAMGTREALFAFAQTVVDPHVESRVVMPNPGYQIYEGAALLAGAEPYYLDTRAENGFVPDLDSVPDWVWKQCSLMYLCSPGNPTGTVLDEAYMARALELADRYDFVIAADECYADIYLRGCAAAGLPRRLPRTRPRPLRARRGLPQSLEALEPSGPSFGLRRRRPGAHRPLPAVPDLPRLRTPGARPAGEHRRVGRRCACERQPGALSREVRRGAADPVPGARRAAAGGEFLSLAGRRR
jgi:hypothetical protein